MRKKKKRKNTEKKICEKAELKMKRKIFKRKNRAGKEKKRSSSRGREEFKM